MAAIQRYVNTASSGGNGTTNDTSGANAAYASLSSWEANEQTDLVAAGNTHTVDCCGSAADTTAVAINGWTTGASNTITIRGNREHANGFYTGAAVISTSHYRIDRGSATTGTTLRVDVLHVTLDGIQIEHGADGNYAAIEGTVNGHTITKCRLRGTTATSSTRGIGYDNSPAGSGTVTITNNLIVGFARSGIHINPSHAYSPTFNVYHNTLYGLPGEAASKGIILDRGTSETLTYNIKGNAFANWNGNDIVETGTAGTVTYNDNATEDYDLGTTGEIDLGLPADAWTSPGVTQASDFTVKNTSSALYEAAAGALVSTDIADAARGGSNYDVGCFELVAAGASGTAASTLAGLVQSASGAETFAGASAQVLAAPSQSGAGLMQPDAVAASVLAAVVQAAAGAETFAGASAQMLAILGQVGNGSMQPDAVAASLLVAIEQAAVGATGDQAGIGVSVLAILGQAGGGLMQPEAVAASLLTALVQEAAGAETFAGSAAQMFAILGQAGGGLMQPAAVAASLLAALVQSAAGAMPPSGAGDSVLARILQQALAASSIFFVIGNDLVFVTRARKATFMPAARGVVFIPRARGVLFGE